MDSVRFTALAQRAAGGRSSAASVPLISSSSKQGLLYSLISQCSEFQGF